VQYVRLYAILARSAPGVATRGGAARAFACTRGLRMTKFGLRSFDSVASANLRKVTAVRGLGQ
jgi:hypothetical protein